MSPIHTEHGIRDDDTTGGRVARIASSALLIPDITERILGQSPRG